MLAVNDLGYGPVRNVLTWILFVEIITQLEGSALSVITCAFCGDRKYDTGRKTCILGLYIT